MKEKRMELKDMLMKKKVDPIYEPNQMMRSSHDVRAAPPM